MKSSVYLDNAATTPIYPKVLDSILPYLNNEYGNPSGVYSLARSARKAIEHAREQVATAIGASPTEIIFTSGGTEANNWILKAIQDGGHIITTKIEHHAILHVCESLKNIEVSYLPVDKQGFVSVNDLEDAIKPNTKLISVMWANNEIGTIQPIKELCEVAKKHNILFHTDAVQAVGHIPVNVKDVPVDFLTMSGHKFGAPKGTGALFIRKGVKLKSFIEGGAQEKNRRAGTENVIGIVGMGEAITISMENQQEEFKRLSQMRDTLIERIKKEIPKVILNGAEGDKRLPGNVNFSFEYIEGESILLLLDMNGIFASSGSACSSASLEPSHVLIAMGVPFEHAHGSIRFSFGWDSKPEYVENLMEKLPKFVEQLRAMSPLTEKE